MTLDSYEAPFVLASNDGRIQDFELRQKQRAAELAEDIDEPPSVQHYPKWVRISILIGGGLAVWMAVVYAALPLFND